MINMLKELLHKKSNKGGMCNIVNHERGQCDCTKREGMSLKLSLDFM